MKNVLYSTLLLLFLIFTKVYGQDKVTRFGIFETEVINPKSYSNPFTDVELNAVFSEPFNKKHFIKGYYAGNNIWKIRFSPDNHRNWSVQYQFSDSEIVHNESFNVLPQIFNQPTEVNTINPYWFKKTVNPLFIKGITVDKKFLINCDTTYFKRLKQTGFNLIYIKDTLAEGLNFLVPGSKNYDEFENSIRWLYQNDLTIVLPLNWILPLKADENLEQINHSLSYFFSRMGVYRNNMYYLSETVSTEEFNSWEMKKFISEFLEHNSFKHPFSFENQRNKIPFINNQFFFTGTDYLDVDSTLGMPVLKEIKVGESSEDAVISFLCEAFCNAQNCVLDIDSKFNTDITNKIIDLWSFFENLPFFNMKPVTGNTDNGNCIGWENEEFLILWKKNSSSSLSLNQHFYRAYWINPFDINERYDAGVVTQISGLNAPNTDHDWLLHLKHIESGFPFGIHLSWINQPSTSLTVTWMTISENNPAKVRFKKHENRNWTELQGISKKSPGNVWIHSANMQDLEPETIYDYKVSADNNLPEIFSEVKTIKTLPEKDNASFKFSFITDTGLDGRLDNNATGAVRFVHEIIKENPDFLLGGGDYAYANRDKRFKNVEGNIIQWFKQSEPALSAMPFMAQFGNHELYLQEKYEDWAPFFQHPKGFGDNRHYSFDVGNVHFTSFCLVDKLPSSKELEWLEEDLKKAKEEGKWIVVYHHEPIFAYGSSHPSKPEITKVIFPILRKYEVDLDISGHDQNYERTFPLSGNDAINPLYTSSESRVYKKGEGTVFLKISPGGKKSEIGNIFPLFHEAPGFIASRDRSAHHLGVFKINEGNSVEVQIYNVPEDKTPRYIIDQFIITK
jgi:acid phosphatase type 7